MPTNNEKGPWRVRDYCDYRRVSKQTVYGWMSRGWLGSVKIGGCRFILPEHDEVFISRFNDQGEDAK